MKQMSNLEELCGTTITFPKVTCPTRYDQRGETERGKELKTDFCRQTGQGQHCCWTTTDPSLFMGSLAPAEWMEQAKPVTGLTLLTLRTHLGIVN